MTEKDVGTDSEGRRRKRFLTPQEKYEIWLRLLRKEATIAEAATGAGVDPATVMKLREVAKQIVHSMPWRPPGPVSGPRGSTPSWPKAGPRSNGSPRR